MPEVTLPTSTRILPPEFNPLRRLYAAAVVQALRDLNNSRVSGSDKFSARNFLHCEADFICDTFELDRARFLRFIRGRGR